MSLKTISLISILPLLPICSCVVQGKAAGNTEEIEFEFRSRDRQTGEVKIAKEKIAPQSAGAFVHPWTRLHSNILFSTAVACEM